MAARDSFPCLFFSPQIESTTKREDWRRKQKRERGWSFKNDDSHKPLCFGKPSKRGSSHCKSLSYFLLFFLVRTDAQTFSFFFFVLRNRPGLSSVMYKLALSILLNRACPLFIFSSRTLLPTTGTQLGQFLVVSRVDKTWIRIAMHQRVDLKLSLVERVRWRLHHVAVNDLTYSRI